MSLSRRSLITGLIAFTATAPAIVRAASIMPVKQMLPTMLDIPTVLVPPVTWLGTAAHAGAWITGVHLDVGDKFSMAGRVFEITGVRSVYQGAYAPWQHVIGKLAHGQD